MSKKLRIGIIGTGGIAHAHMKAYKTFDDVEIETQKRILNEIHPNKA